MQTITITEAHYKRTVAALNETKNFIGKYPKSELFEYYAKHAIALDMLISEVHVVNELSADDGLKSVESFVKRLKEIKAAI